MGLCACLGCWWMCSSLLERWPSCTLSCAKWVRKDATISKWEEQDLSRNLHRWHLVSDWLLHSVPALAFWAILWRVTRPLCWLSLRWWDGVICCTFCSGIDTQGCYLAATAVVDECLFVCRPIVVMVYQMFYKDVCVFLVTFAKCLLGCIWASVAGHLHDLHAWVCNGGSTASQYFQCHSTQSTPICSCRRDILPAGILPSVWGFRDGQFHGSHQGLLRYNVMLGITCCSSLTCCWQAGWYWYGILPRFFKGRESGPEYGSDRVLHCADFGDAAERAHRHGPSCLPRYPW